MTAHASPRAPVATPTELDPRWRAVVARDAAADGAFYYSVRTTGVYCFPSCAARLANPENVRFHDTRVDAEALASAKKTLAQNPNYPKAIIMAAVSAALAGHKDVMTKAVSHLLKIDPACRMSSFRNMWPLRRKEDLAAFEKGLQLTKLPE